ncbi:MAG: response regulator, partial [Gemmataceae bacterium]
HSDGHGKGSEFVVRLPLGDTPYSTSDSGILTVTVANKHRVLVVDDNVDAAQSLAMVLRLKGHTVSVAHIGRKALELARKERPEFAFLDQGMPPPNGYEVARALRGLPDMQHLTLIALTGYGQDEHRHLSREAGFDLHLVKPVDADAVEKIFAAHDARLAAASR